MSRKVSRELNRLVTAAVVSKRFCELLLNDPAGAIAAGYDDEVFLLTAEEYDLVLSIQASTLGEFARQLLDLTGTDLNQSDDDRPDPL